MDKKPAEVFHPGMHLLDELEARDWAIPAFSYITMLQPNFIHDIINGERDITQSVANVFSKALGTSAEYWLSLQRAWDERNK